MSVFTDVAAESILLAGGGRAILLQIADPAVGRAVSRHSDFANRPLDRFANTVTYAYAAVFGSAAERAEVVRRVNRAHGPVHSAPRNAPPAGSRAGGGDPTHTDTRPADPADHADTHPEADRPHEQTGPGAVGPPREHPGAGGERPYDAVDPGAQLWVAATLYQSAVTVYERVFGALDAIDAEEVYRQYAVLGTSLQVPPTLWPADLAAFRDYWVEAVAKLEVTDDARAVAHDLLHPRTAPLWLRAAMPVVRLLTAGLLSDELRRAYVLPWSAVRQRRFDRLFSITAAAYPRLPARLRHVARDRHLRGLRVAMAQP